VFETSTERNVWIYVMQRNMGMHEEIRDVYSSSNVVRAEE